MAVRYQGGSKSYGDKPKPKKKKKLKKIDEAETNPLTLIRKRAEKKAKPPKKLGEVKARVKVSTVALNNLSKAATELKTVEILYLDKEGKKSRRIIEPYSIKEKNGSWKLYGFCLMRQAIRSFDINSIMESYVLARFFEPRFEVTLPLDLNSYYTNARM